MVPGSNPGGPTIIVTENKMKPLIAIESASTLITGSLSKAPRELFCETESGLEPRLKTELRNRAGRRWFCVHGKTYPLGRKGTNLVSKEFGRQETGNHLPAGLIENGAGGEPIGWSAIDPHSRDI